MKIAGVYGCSDNMKIAGVYGCPDNMKIAGVICEYNPFHNGHKYHLEQIRRELGECIVICCMSGSFTQRGELAILPPTERARAALLGGADIVFELPVLHTIRSAEGYARGGVHLLDSLGVCDYLSFGCEDVGLLWDTYNMEAQSNVKCADKQIIGRTGTQCAPLPARLAEGNSYARACGLPNLPNLILGVEYMRALADVHSKMQALAIERACEQNVASAGTIRRMLRGGENAASLIPSEINEEKLRFTESLDTLLLGMLRASSTDIIRETQGVSEGLENLIYRHAFRASSRDELIHMVKSKRYTYTRISRILAQFMLGISKDTAAASPVPHYARLLGFRESARPVLRRMQDDAQINIITKPAAMKRDALFRLDAKAAGIASLASADMAHSIFEESPIILYSLS
jgi:predicted nucleotidyltransferase